MTTLLLPRFPVSKFLGAASAPVLLAGLLLAALPGAAMPALADSQTHLAITRAAFGGTRSISLPLNKSLIVDLPADAREVIVSQPAIAMANMRSKRRAILQGMGIGDTNIVFLDDKGAQIAALEVSVVRDDSTLSTALAHLLPGSDITVQGFGEHIVLSGTAVSQDDVAKAMSIASQFAGGDANIANIITVSGPQQVALKVTVAEVSRQAVKQLGLNLTGQLSAGALTTGIVNNESLGGASNIVTSNSISGSLDVPGLSLKATLQALEQRGLSRTLDEPTLTAMSGQAAEFVAGGEFPVPTAIDQLGQVNFRSTPNCLKL